MSSLQSNRLSRYQSTKKWVVELVKARTQFYTRLNGWDLPSAEPAASHSLRSHPVAQSTQDSSGDTAPAAPAPASAPAATDGSTSLAALWDLSGPPASARPSASTEAWAREARSLYLQLYKGEFDYVLAHLTRDIARYRRKIRRRTADWTSHCFEDGHSSTPAPAPTPGDVLGYYSGLSEEEVRNAYEVIEDNLQYHSPLLPAAEWRGPRLFQPRGPVDDDQNQDEEEEKEEDGRGGGGEEVPMTVKTIQGRLDTAMMWRNRNRRWTQDSGGEESQGAVAEADMAGFAGDLWDTLDDIHALDKNGTALGLRMRRARINLDRLLTAAEEVYSDTLQEGTVRQAGKRKMIDSNSTIDD